MAFRHIIHPELYQGAKKKKNYFEGWYYKMVTKDLRHSVAFIPGISKNPEDPHAFIQMFLTSSDDKETGLLTDYVRFGPDDFSFDDTPFKVMIKDNTFSKDALDIHLKTAHGDVSGSFSFTGITPINTSLLVPNVMGPFGYLGFMECYHGIISMTHTITGTLRIGEKTITFDEGKGYIEKDWGKSFPESYIWIQSNHFKDPKTSLLVSYATIPFLGFSFKGLITNLLIGGREYRFATYNGAKVIDFETGDRHVLITMRKGPYRLDVKAEMTSSVDLASPRNGKMIETIKEGLSGTVTFSLSKKGHILHEDTGTSAGIEIMMDAA
jgi:tocopherol cyclase